MNTQRKAPRTRRRRSLLARAGGVLLVLALVGPTAGCSGGGGPSEKELREEARSSVASARRSAEERRVRQLVARLTAVDGLVHLRTRFLDRCTTPTEGDLLEPADPHALECGIQATVHFGVRGSITDVLPRIRAAHIASWGPQTETGGDVPGAAGTVAYALRYHRDRGKYSDGTLMAGPGLESPGLRIDWDRPGMPLPYEVEKPSPCPSGGTGRIYQRCEIAPAVPMSLTVARARYGTVLVFDVLGPVSGDGYFAVARSR